MSVAGSPTPHSDSVCILMSFYFHVWPWLWSFNFSWKAGIGLTCCCIHFPAKKNHGKGRRNPLPKKKKKLKKPYPVKNYHQFVRIRLHPPQTRTLSGSAVLSAGWHTLLLTWCKIEIASSMETEGAAAFQVTSPWVTVPEKTVNSVLSSFKVPPALLLQQSLANKRNVAQNTASCC